MKPRILSLFFLLLCSAASLLATENAVEQRFIQAGLIDVATVDPTIKVDLVNSDPKKNIFRKDFYKGLERAYLQKRIAVKLSQAQKILNAAHPGYSLCILDAARPRSVSQAMYDQMKGTRFEKYVANPERGSMHNYGIAVDLTILDEHGHPLDMGITPFNKSTAQIYWDYTLRKLGKKLSREQKRNRDLLAATMQQAGFFPLHFEWWHFNGMPKDGARKTYTIIE